MKLFALALAAVSAQNVHQATSTWEASCEDGLAISNCGSAVTVLNEPAGTVCRFDDGVDARVSKQVGGGYILSSNEFFSLDYGNEGFVDSSLTVVSLGEGSLCSNEDWWNETKYDGCDLGSVTCDYGTPVPDLGFFFMDTVNGAADNYALQFWGRSTMDPWMVSNPDPENSTDMFDGNQMQHYNDQVFVIDLVDASGNQIQIANHSCGSECTSSVDANGDLVLTTNSPNVFVFGFEVATVNNQVPDLWQSTINN